MADDPTAAVFDEIAGGMVQDMPAEQAIAELNRLLPDSEPSLDAEEPPEEEEPVQPATMDDLLKEVQALSSELDVLRGQIDNEPNIYTPIRASELEDFVEETAELFDLYSRTATTFKVRGAQSGKCVCIAGVHVEVTSGGAGALDATITPGASVYVYLNMKRGTPDTATLEIDSGAFGDGDDDEERDYLWYVPFAASAITWGSIVPMRGMPHLPAMA